MYESFTLQMMVDCDGCGSAVPVNGIVEEISCKRCGHDITLEREFWADCFDGQAFAEALGCEPGHGQRIKRIGVKFAYGRRWPRCQKCKGPDLDPAVLATSLSAGASTCFCPGCGNRLRLRPADGLCRAINPAARFVVGEEFGPNMQESLQKQRQMVLFTCMGCGAGLPVDGSVRAVVCTYCNASNYIPDGLWQELNPVPTVTTFFLVCEYDAQSLALARQQSGSAMSDGSMTFEANTPGAAAPSPNGPWHVGRSAISEIHIADHGLSLHHAKIERFPNGTFQITDLQSTEGVFVLTTKKGFFGSKSTWTRLRSPTILSADDVVRLAGLETSVGDLIARASRRTE